MIINHYSGQAMLELQGKLIPSGHNEMKLWRLDLNDDGRVALAQRPDGWIHASIDAPIYRPER